MPGEDDRIAVITRIECSRCGNELHGNLCGYGCPLDNTTHSPSAGDAVVIEYVPASQLAGAVDLIDEAVGCVTEAFNQPAHSWHGSDKARRWLMRASTYRGQS